MGKLVYSKESIGMMAHEQTETILSVPELHWARTELGRHFIFNFRTFDVDVIGNPNFWGKVLSKNNSTCENAITRICGHWMLQVMGSRYTRNFWKYRLQNKAFATVFGLLKWGVQPSNPFPPGSVPFSLCFCAVAKSPRRWGLQVIHIKFPTLPHTYLHCPVTVVVVSIEAHPSCNNTIFKRGLAAIQPAGHVSRASMMRNTTVNHSCVRTRLESIPAWREGTIRVAASAVGLVTIGFT